MKDFDLVVNVYHNMPVVDVEADQGGGGGGGGGGGAWKTSCIKIQYRFPVFHAMYYDWGLGIEFTRY